MNSLIPNAFGPGDRDDPNKGYSIAESAVMIAKTVGFSGDIRFRPALQDGAFQKVMNDELFRRHFPKFEFIDHQLGIYKTVEYYRDRLLADSYPERYRA